MSGWSPLDTWVVEVYDGDVMVGRTSSDSEVTDLQSRQQHELRKLYLLETTTEPFQIGHRWVLYRWITNRMFRNILHQESLERAMEEALSNWFMDFIMVHWEQQHSH